MHLRLTLALLGLILTAACATPTQLAPERAPAPLSSPLPPQYAAGLPAPLDLLARGVSAVPGELARNGAQVDVVGGANRVAPSGQNATFTPQTGFDLNDHAWAIYRFNLTGHAGMPEAQLDWQAAPQPANLHVAAGNFVTGRWDWLPLTAVARANLGALAPYRAADGTALLVVLLSGGPPAELALVAFGAPLAETFEDRAPAGNNATKWLVNCYAPLPEWRDADRVFQQDSLREFADEVLALTNAERATLLLPPLEHDPHLELLAQAHSRHMGLREFFDHDEPDYGHDPFQRFELMDPPFYAFAGENIAWGQLDPAEVMTDWINSPGHHANIVHPAFTHLGVGVYWRRGAISWTQFFASFPTDPAAHDWLDPDEVPVP